MQYNLIIPRLTSLNEYSNAERSNRYTAARIKKQNSELISYFALSQLGRLKIIKPVYIKYLWVEPDRKRDLDNISFAKKFIQDSLVQLGILQNDGWKQITGFSDSFKVDKSDPRVEITIIESEG